MRPAKILLLGLVLGVATYANAERPGLGNPQLHVFVLDDAGASASLVAGAERVATRVFERAGMAMAWINCEAPSAATCATEIQPGDLVLRIVPRARVPQPRIFGISFLAPDGTGSYADVFLDPIRRLQVEAAGVSLVSTLGDVMAHELGHLLLGTNAHSQQGIMQAHWQSRQLRDISMGHMLFTTEQAERIRERVAMAHKEIPALAAASY